MPKPLVSAAYSDDDLKAWQEYKKSPTPLNRTNLLKRFDGLIQNQVNRWMGPLPRETLEAEAKTLAVKAFDTYNPNAGAQLSTYLTSQLQPLSRLVYTYQNAARMPERIAQKMVTFTQANESLKLTLGREPTTDELHNELGWNAADINKVRGYNRRDLVESGPAVSGSFFEESGDDKDDILLGAIYFELSPDEKQLFELVTGYNGVTPLKNPELAKKLGISLPQLSYRKDNLKKHIDRLLKFKKGAW